MLNRQLPSELMLIFEKAGIDLFPNSWRDLDGSCSCPDYAVPCKHMAAVLYLVANEIDKNPFLVFQLHDFDLFKGLEGIGYAAKKEQDVKILLTEKLWQPFSMEDGELPWNEELYQQIDFSILPDCRENLLAILSEQPVFYTSGDFKKILNTVYKSVAKAMTPKKTKEDIESSDLVDQVEDVEILLDTEMDFLIATLRNAKGKSILEFTHQEKFITWLNNISFAEIGKASNALKGLYLIFLFSKKITQQSAYIPQLLRVSPRHYRVRWIPAFLNETIQTQLTQLKELITKDFIFYKKQKEILEATIEEKLMSALSFFINYWVQNHHGLKPRLQENDVVSLFFNQSLESFPNFENREFPIAIQLWLNKFFIVDKDFVPIIQVDEKDEGIFKVNLAIEDSTQPVKTPIPLKKLLTLKKYSGIRLDALRDLAMLSEYFPQITQLVASQGKEELYFDSEEFVHILFKILPSIRLFGIKVLLPKALRKLLRPQASVSIEGNPSGIVKEGSGINLERMMAFSWQVAIGDQQVSFDEFQKMVKQFSGIVKMNDQYVFFDEKEIQSLIEKMQNPPDLDGNKLLQIALAEEYDGAEIQLDKNAQKIMTELLKGEGTKVPKGLRATLRPYQLRGYEWMYKNSKLGLGSLIADDMGLGKTLQVIATLLKLKEELSLIHI